MAVEAEAEEDHQIEEDRQEEIEEQADSQKGEDTRLNNHHPNPNLSNGFSQIPTIIPKISTTTYKNII